LFIVGDIRKYSCSRDTAVTNAVKETVPLAALDEVSTTVPYEPVVPTEVLLFVPVYFTVKIHPSFRI
jgi:hypothetical protein